jgi:hypothetical protein
MLDEKLRALMAMDAPAARDPSFQLAVMARIEQRRFHRAILVNVTVALAVALVLALAMPVLQPLWQAKFAPRISDLTIAVALFVSGYAALQFARAEN